MDVIVFLLIVVGLCWLFGKYWIRPWFNAGKNHTSFQVEFEKDRAAARAKKATR